MSMTVTAATAPYAAYNQSVAAADMAKNERAKEQNSQAQDSKAAEDVVQISEDAR